MKTIALHYQGEVKNKAGDYCHAWSSKENDSNPILVPVSWCNKERSFFQAMIWHCKDQMEDLKSSNI